MNPAGRAVSTPEDQSPRHWRTRAPMVVAAFDRPLLFICAVVVLTSSVSAYRHGHLPDDLAVYRGAIDAWRSGGSLYSFHRANGDGFTYPPGAAIILTWIHYVDPAILSAIWVILSGGALWACSLSLHRYCRVPTGFAFGLLLFSAAGRSNVLFGQISVFVFALCLIDCCLVPERHRGYLSGIAAAIKLTPVLFIGYFLVRREWGNALRSAAAAATLTLAGAVAMPNEFLQYAHSGLLSVASVSDWDSEGNQSIRAVLARLSVPHYETISSVLGLILVVAVLAFVRTARPRRLDGWVLIGLVTILISPISWTHHRLWLTVPLLMPWLWRGPFRAAAWCLATIASLVGAVGHSIWLWPIRESGLLVAVLMILMICWNTSTEATKESRQSSAVSTATIPTRS